MGKGRIRLLRAIPGSASLRPIVQDFRSKPTGVITAFSDALLPLCRQEVGDDGLIEVMPFGELVFKYLQLTGEEALPLASSSFVTAAVAEACAALPESSPLSRAARFPGTHAAIVSTLDELHHWGLMPQELAGLATGLSGRLADKVASLALVDGECQRLLGLLGRQTHCEQMKLCLEGTPELDGEFERILVFAGSEASPLKIEWLQWAAAQGTDVTIVVDRHATDGRIFHGADQMCAALGVPGVEIGSGNRVQNNLFAATSQAGPAIAVEIASTSDSLAEAEWAIRACMEREGRIGIYVRNLEAYAPLLEASAKRLGVPIRVSRRAPLLTNAFARLTLTVLEFIASDDVRSLSPILCSSYLGLDGASQDLLSGGLREAHRMRALQWQWLSKWATDNEAQFPWLAKVMATRDACLGESLHLVDWAVRLRKFTEELPWKDQGLPETEYSRARDTRANTQLQRVLASYASVERAAERPPVSLKQFVATCRMLWEAADVSIPTGDDGVPVSAVADGLEDVDTLIVLGMLEGIFPRRRTEDPILTDLDRKAISQLLTGEPPLRTSHDVAVEERDVFYRVCAAAKRRLVFSYPQADDQRDNVPAFYLELLRNAVPDVHETDRPRSALAPSAENCRCESDRALRAALDGERELPLANDVDSPRVQDLLGRDPNDTVTPAELRDAATCSFQYLSRHRLKLRPKRASTRWSSLQKLPQAAGLANQPTPESATLALTNALEAELEENYAEIPEWEARLLRSGGRRLIADWVRREFRARTIWPRDRDTVKQNVGFGTNGVRDASFAGTKLSGVIPALTNAGNFRVAHLFASGVRDAKDMTSSELMYLGVLLGSLHQPGTEAGVEIETMAGKRRLYVLSRLGPGQLTSDVRAGLEVVNLATNDDPIVSKKIFFDKVKTLVGQAANRIRQGSVETTRGDHCDHCDFGELCRRHRVYGEESSPFGIDEVFDDA